MLGTDKSKYNSYPSIYATFSLVYLSIVRQSVMIKKNFRKIKIDMNSFIECNFRKIQKQQQKYNFH